jgi:hypothetical protein
MAEKKFSAESLELFDSIMNATPEALHLLPEYKAFPQGSFLCELKCDPKEGLRELKDEPYFAVEFKLTEDGEMTLGDGVEQEDIPNPGDICSTLFKLNDEIGQGRLRNMLTSFKIGMGKANEEMTNTEILAMAHGSLVRVACKKPTVKDDKKFANIIGVEFVS